MADQSPTEERSDPGASVAKDAIGSKDTAPDPDMIKLKRKPAKVSVITAAGVVFLSALFLLRLHGDRTFGGNETPETVTVADIVSDKVPANSFVTITGEPMMSHAIRASQTKTGIGLRVVPMRGTADRLWIVIHGDGWDPPNMTGYTGRLRELEDLPFIDAIRDYAAAHPRPVFATVRETRAALGSGEVAMVSGDRVEVSNSDRVAFDVVDPGSALVIAAINERHASAQAWTAALTAAGLVPGTPLAGASDTSPPGADGKPTQIRFEIEAPDAVTTVTAKLEAAGLWAARVEPITRHYTMSWGELRAAMKGSLDTVNLGGVQVPTAAIDLFGFYTAKSIPDGAYALITSEKPQDYWHVWPITIALALIFLVFAWALVRAVKRDMLSPAQAAPSS